MYTVTDLTELIRHHLVLSTDDAKADINLAQTFDPSHVEKALAKYRP